MVRLHVGRGHLGVARVSCVWKRDIQDIYIFFFLERATEGSAITSEDKEAEGGAKKTNSTGREAACQKSEALLVRDVFIAAVVVSVRIVLRQPAEMLTSWNND